jgi:hypothetical protein
MTASGTHLPSNCGETGLLMAILMAEKLALAAMGTSISYDAIGSKTFE